MLNLIKKFINSPEGKKIFKKVKDKNTKNKKETSTVSKNNNTKVGISASILNQSNLLKKNPQLKRKHY
jgi:hypothetical protein